MPALDLICLGNSYKEDGRSIGGNRYKLAAAVAPVPASWGRHFGTLACEARA